MKTEEAGMKTEVADMKPAEFHTRILAHHKKTEEHSLS